MYCFANIRSKCTDLHSECDKSSCIALNREENRVTSPINDVGIPSLCIVTVAKLSDYVLMNIHNFFSLIGYAVKAIAYLKPFYVGNECIQ